MDSKSADVDVNKLLQQLEELKRKKAQSEKKLKKLVKCSPKVKIILEKRKSRHSLPRIPENLESEAICDQVGNLDKENLTVSKSCTSATNLSNNTELSLSLADNCAPKENNKLNIKSSDSPLRVPDIFNGEKKPYSQEFYNSNICKATQRTPACELSSSNNCLARNSELIVLSNEHQINESCSRKRSSEDAGKDVDILSPDVRKKQKINNASSISNSIESGENVEITPMDTEARFGKTTEESREMPGVSNKVDSSECHHNSSYFMEECFDNDMTCVLSSQVTNCREEVAKEQSQPQNEEQAARDLCHYSKYSLSELSFSDSMQCSYSNVELPKFSSPTDGCILDATEKEQDKGIGSSHCALSSGDCVPVKAQIRSEALSPDNTYNPANLKHVLSSELSSVLDAHYESPDKVQKDNGIERPKSVRFKTSDDLKELWGNADTKSVQSNDRDMRLADSKRTSIFCQDVGKDSTILVKSTSEIEVIDLGVDDSVTFLPSLTQSGSEDVPAYVKDKKCYESVKNNEDASAIFGDIKSASYKKSDRLDINFQVSITVDSLVHQVCKLYSASVMERNDVHPAESNVDCCFKPDSEVLFIPETEFFGADDFAHSEVADSTLLPTTETNEHANSLKMQIIESEAHDEVVPNVPETEFLGADDVADSELVESAILPNAENPDAASHLNRQIAESEFHDIAVHKIPETEVLYTDDFAETEDIENTIHLNTEINEQTDNLKIQNVEPEAHVEVVPSIQETDVFGSNDFSDSELVENTIIPNTENLKVNNFTEQIVESESHLKSVHEIPETEVLCTDDFADSEVVESTIVPSTEISEQTNNLKMQVVELEAHEKALENVPETELFGSDDFSDSELVENTVSLNFESHKKASNLNRQSVNSESHDKAVQEIPETEVLCTDVFADSEVLENTIFPNMKYEKEINNLSNKIVVSETHEAELREMNKLPDSEVHFSDSEQPKNVLKAPMSQGNSNRTLSKEWEQNTNRNCSPDNEFMDTNLFDTENSQELGNYKSVPFLAKDEEVKAESSKLIQAAENDASHLSFVCCLNGNGKESVNDVQTIIFNDNTYVFVQFTTCIEVWRHQAHEDWMKIFVHQVDDALQLKKLCLLKSEDYLSLVLLLTSQQEHCLQFVLFERNSKIIKVLENSHWLNEGQSADTVLLCDLNGLTFATAQGDDIFKVHSHTFADMKDNPRLISVELGSTTNPLCSICKIEKLPNALMGISPGTLYVWHLLEARLVTAVTLQPQDYLPIIDCIWSTVEKGLVFFITTTKDENNVILSQLLAANLATGFCQTVIPFNVRPAKLNDQESEKTVKAKYCEPYLLVTCKGQAFFWSVMDEYCCAVLDETHNITAVTAGQDIEGYHLVALGNETGCVNFYKLN